MSWHALDVVSAGQRLVAPLTGLAAGAITLASAGLLAAVARLLGFTQAESSPLVAIGSAFIDITPAWLKDWAITTFGTSDKLALLIGMGLTVCALCALLGWCGAPESMGGWARPILALLIFAVVGVAAMLIIASRPQAGFVFALPTLLGTAAGMAALGRFWAAASVSPGSGQDTSRRRILGWALGTTVAGTATAIVADAGRGVAAPVKPVALVVPAVSDPVSVPPGAQIATPGLTPYITPNSEFYRIDTALIPPRVDPNEWQLRVHGLVRRTITIDLPELLAQPMQESLTTLACVSNGVGGPLVGNAVWTGWPIRKLLARAEPLPEADMVLSMSVDGFTASTPLTALTDDRNAVLAVGMNAEPLPIEHGYPVRMVVPGLYGYVSATKWVIDLKVTRFADDVAYWTPRGWSPHGPIKMSSRIDVPSTMAQVGPGVVPIAGVAWAQQRGISQVEVRISPQVGGKGSWQQAELAEEPSIDSWRQWVWHWEVQEPGRYTVEVRATDGDGQVQTAQNAPPAPNGSSGHHTIFVNVI